MKIILNKISVKLILATVISLFGSLEACYLFTVIMNYLLEDRHSLTIQAYNILIYAIVLWGIGIYILCFILIVNRKIKYIKYIAKSVKRISKEDLGSTIEIQGNDELADLSSSINSMSLELKERREREKEIENIKNELITNVSHDLRTPLTSIIGYVDLLKKKEFKNEEQQREYIDVIYNKSQNLQKLINELFEYTTLTTPGIQVSRSYVDLGSLLEQLVGEYVPIFAKENLNIIRDIPEQDIMVNVDIEKMVRVFENILTNAKKYSLKPSDIYVKLHTLNNKAIVAISNKTDINPAENLDILFDKSYRADTARRESDGAGLGLAIAKRIVELHDGRIWAEYTDGYITFSVELILG